MAKIIQFPVERARRSVGIQPFPMSLVWFPLAMSGYFWLCSADAMLNYWGFVSGPTGHSGRSPQHRCQPGRRG
ncbi:hypothetical protein MKP05_18740 [Halomonas sp. EGI 63088]|uniref:Uncharacterized protein n=1 Tax=Halomonas flagellata TaxID=2920385 RepID=A0ABS9RZ90_9GAMM|nr:hypothetical protein [Halomonas flagellata]MCH4565139.1 hypothetical protein [Halomonas flagellata]